MYRLRGKDAQFIYNETASSPCATIKVMIYEPVSPDDAPGIEELGEYIKKSLNKINKSCLPLRIIRVPFDLHHPVWVVDPEFNFDNHIRYAALPRPGDKQALCNFIAEVLSTPLDPNQPLWKTWIVEGLEGGRLAVISKVHHVLADGLLTTEAIANAHEGGKVETIAKPKPEKIPGKLRLIGDAMVDLLKSYTVELPGYLRLNSEKREASKILKERGEDAVAPFTAPYTFINRPGGPNRLFQYETMPLDEFKAIAKKLDCTINTLVMGICSEALRRYFLDVDKLPDVPLTTVMPVGLSRENEIKEFLNTQIFNNNVGLAFVPLDLNITNFKKRLESIRQGSKSAMDLIRATEGRRIDNFADYLPGSFFRLTQAIMARQQKKRKNPFSNLSISNVPGPRETLYACKGRLKMTELISAGNLGDPTCLTVTVWSYVNNLCFACHYRKDAIPQPERFNRHIAEFYQELKAEHLGQQALSEASTA